MCFSRSSDALFGTFFICFGFEVSGSSARFCCSCTKSRSYWYPITSLIGSDARVRTPNASGAVPPSVLARSLESADPFDCVPEVWPTFLRRDLKPL